MVRVFTNSVCDLTPAQAEELGVTMIPDMIAFGPGEQYRNNEQIDPPTLYKKLAQSDELPTTAHPNLDQYMQAFRSVDNGDEILCISLTSKMSGSYNTACSACRLLQEQGVRHPHPGL